MKRYLLLLLPILFLSLTKAAKADHVMGADIQWKCLGNDTYQIIFKFYRDCRGIPKSGSVTLSFTSDSCANSRSGSITCNRVSLTDITPVCSANKPCNPANTMLTSIPYGIEEHRFEGKVYLGGTYTACCWYKFTFSECCRSGPINTGHSWANFSTELWLNRCITPCDNGPQFNNPPIAIKCAGQDVVYNHGVVDADGDSLVYVKALPNGANYIAPWSVNYPLTVFPGNNPNVSPNPNAVPPIGFYLDPLSGDMIFRPMQQQETVLKVRVEEWRKINGVYKLIGVATRDMQFIILANCTNKNPTLSGLTSYEACAGQQICFTINTNDLDFLDTTKIYYDNSIPGATWTSTNGTAKRAQGTFCWTPQESDASTLPYYFRATVEDDHCPLNGRSTRSYAILVKPTPKNTRNFTKGRCGLWTLEATPVSNYFNGAQYKWYVPKLIGTGSPVTTYAVSQNTSYQFPEGGKYVIKSTMTFNGCTNTYFDTIQVDTVVQVMAPPDTAICKGKSIQLTATVKGGNPAYHYKWSNNDTLSSITIAPQADTVLYITVSDRDTCIATDTVNVLVKNLPTITHSPDTRICNGDSVLFDAGNITPGMHYLWKKNGAFYSTSRQITAHDSGEYVIHIIDTFGCEAFDTTRLFVNDKVVIGPVQDVPVCKGDTATLTATGAMTYEWRELSTGNLVSTSATLTASPLTTTTYTIKGSFTYQGITCFGYDTADIVVKERPTISFPVFPKRCVDGNPVFLNCTVKYNNIPVPPSNLVWSCPSAPTALINGNQFDPKATAPAGGTFVLYVTADYNGCSSTDSTTITISPLPVVSAGSDQSFCENYGNTLLDTMASPFDVKYGTWSILSTNTPAAALNTTPNPPGYSYYFDPGIAGVGYHSLIYKYKDFITGCENSDTVVLHVIPIPVAVAGSLPDVCADNGIINLAAATGCTPPGGTWSGTGVTGGIFDPAINTGTTTQTYTLKYLVAAIGCSDEDSLTVTVHPVPKVKLDTVGTLCVNTGNVQLNGTPSAGGTGTYSGPGVTGNTFNTKTAGPGTHKIKYHYKETAAPYCEQADSILITVQDEPAVSIDPVATLCEDDIRANGVNITCKVNSPFGVQWSADSAGGFANPNGVSTVYHPSYNEITNHKITFTVTSTLNGVCAPAQAVIDANIYPTPHITFTGDLLQGCKPLTVRFTSVTDAGTGASYYWDFGDPASGSNNNSTDANPTHTYNDSGLYSVYVKVTTANGCFNTYRITNYIEVFPYPVAQFKADPAHTTVALPKIKFYNESRGNEPMTYYWNYGDMSPVETTTGRTTLHTYSVNDTGYYTVLLRVASREGCEDTISQKVYIGPDLTVFIPNVFSPDGSGPLKNEKFLVVAGGIHTFNLRIFDRWGEELFHSTSLTDQWDGTYHNLPCQPDVYIYKVIVTGYDDKKHEYNGTVTLIR